MNKDTIVVVDAYAHIYRAFYAVRALCNSKGQPTNALYAISNFFLQLNDKYNSDFGAFAFDKGKPKFRMEVAPDYKGNRSPMPDELRSQIEHIRRLVGLFGWNILETEELEADDIIGVIAKKFINNDVRIFSADKDIAQLTNERVKMYIPDTKKGGQKLQGLEEVRVRFGIDAHQIIDYLAMLGDVADNIPGVQGVGPKTAVKLLEQFGSVDAMYEKIDEISNVKLKAKIESSKEILKKNKFLITLKCDFEDKQWDNLDCLIRKKPDWHAIADFAEEFELKSILKKIVDRINYEDVNDFAEMEQEEDLFSFANSAEVSDEIEVIKESIEEESEIYTPSLF